MIVFAGKAALAQQVIQQPVVGVTSVNTSVSVPDRGQAYLGGVSSAQSGRSQYGPLRSGTATGLSRESTSISTSVYIHDLQAMDEALLNSATTPRTDPRNNRFVRTHQAEPEPMVSALAKSAKFEALAQMAEKAGKQNVAKLHWQMAAKYGSPLAAQKLAAPAHSSSTTTIARKTLRSE